MKQAKQFRSAVGIARLHAMLSKFKPAVPYPQHCLQPEKCAGKSNCQRDPNCID